MTTLEHLNDLAAKAEGKPWDDPDRVKFDLALRNTYPAIREVLEAAQEWKAAYGSGTIGVRPAENKLFAALSKLESSE